LPSSSRSADSWSPSLGVLDRLGDLRGHLGDRLELVADHLAEEEVQTLDRRGALVEGVDLGVADVLLDRVVLQEPEPPYVCSDCASISYERSEPTPLTIGSSRSLIRSAMSSSPPVSPASATLSCHMAV
jgi:hypothetical protein